MRHGLVLAALLLTGAAPDPHPARLAGTYDGGQTELAAGLELRADGHFRYGLSYGALDENAAGTWEAAGDRVLLTSDPPVTPPRFVVERDEAMILGGLVVTLADPAVLQGARLGLLLLYPGDEPRYVEVEEGGRVTFPDSRQPAAIVPQLPVFPVDSAPIPLEGKAGHRLLLRFEANDIGKADFRGESLRIDRGTLVMQRFGRTISFRRR